MQCIGTIFSLSDECHSCKELIKSDTILAGPHHFHEQCFTCAHCNMRLGENFYSINSENYCLQHKDVRNIAQIKPLTQRYLSLGSIEALF